MDGHENKFTEEMTDQLKRTERIRALGQMAAYIAHDLKNLISIVSFSAETLSEKFNLDGEVKEYVDIINKNSQRSAQIVKELLNFTKVKNSALEPGLVTDVLESSLKLITVKCSKQSIDIHRDFSGENKRVLLDPFELRAAFMNLILNSVEAMPDGGKLTVTSRHNAKEKAVQVQIKDTGKGTKKENIKHMGQAFFTTKSDGSGLGLFISMEIVRSHKGDISIKNNQDKPGLTVTVTLPCIQ